MKEDAEEIEQFLTKITVQDDSATLLQKTPALEHLIAKAESGDSEAQWLMYKLHTLRLIYIPIPKKGFHDLTKKWPKSMREDFLMSRKKWIKAEEEEHEAKRKWIKRAAENNHPEALSVYVSGWMKDDTPEERKRFLNLMISAAERGETEPLRLYAWWLKYKTPKLFVKYMTLAAGQGDTDAMVAMGRFFDPIGQPGNRPYSDFRKATKWHRMAAESDGADVRYILEYARLLRIPWNPASDFSESIRWLSIASDMNIQDIFDGEAIQEAQFLLAEIYENGYEVPRNAVLAASLYQRLAKLDVYYLEAEVS